MAAPGGVYEGSLLNGSVPFALRLFEYSDNILMLFYLDALIGKGTAEEPFVGLIINNPSSVFYKYHNTSRHSNVTGTIGGINYIALNDAGLNTLGNVSLGAVYVNFGTGIVLPISYRNAYYVASDGIKVRYRKNGSSTWIEYFAKSSSPANESAVFNTTLTSLAGDLSPNDLVYIEVQNINAEGTITSLQQSITLPFPSLVMAYGAYSSEAWTNYGSNTSKTDRYFSEYEPAVGVEVYGNSSGFINLIAGYYAGPDFWIKVELTAGPDVKSVITKIGAIGVWDTGDPSTPSGYGTFNFIHKEASSPLSRWNQGCSLVGTGGGNAYTAYRSNTDNKFYQETTLNNLISNAYYYTSTTEFLIISGGVSIGTGDCTNGPVFPSEE